MSFGERLAERISQMGTSAVVGIDPLLDRLEAVHLPAEEAAQRVLRFSLDVIEAVAGIVPVVKPQSAFFEQLGAPGLDVLAKVIAAATERELIVLLDGKRGDIGSTAVAYARAQLDKAAGGLGADAVTLSPYLGPESLSPYDRWLEQGKGIFILVRTSNPSASAWQLDTGVAAKVADWIDARCPGPAFGSVGAVVGATLPADEIVAWRARMPHTWFLVPGFGAQGAGKEDVRPHFTADGMGALVSSSREVLYPPTGADREVRTAVRARAQTFAKAVGSLVVGR